MKLLRMRVPKSLFVIAMVSWIVTTSVAQAEPVVLKEADLPVDKLHVLRLGDEVAYLLPNGRQLTWKAERDALGIGEQVAASGLKAQCKEPEFDQLKNYGVSTSGNAKVSIYSFDIDGYRVERAEDLKAQHGLPIINWIGKLGKHKELDHSVVRRRFAKEVDVPKGPVPRVPIGTVHRALQDGFPYSVRLVQINRSIQFDVSGDIAKLTERKREAVLTSMMRLVIDRYEGIGNLASFVFNIMDDNQTLHRYEARKADDGSWKLNRIGK